LLAEQVVVLLTAHPVAVAVALADTGVLSSAN
jgi:hypothetical protein